MRKSLLVLAALLAAGCTQNPQPEASSSPPIPAPVSQEAPAKADPALVAAIYQGTGYPAASTRQDILAQEIRRSFSHEDYTRLEKLGDRLLKESPLPIGADSPLAIYLRILGDPSPPDGWKGADDRFARWEKRFPHSNWAALAHCRLLTNATYAMILQQDDSARSLGSADELLTRSWKLIETHPKAEISSRISTKIHLAILTDPKSEQKDQILDEFDHAHQAAPDQSAPAEAVGRYYQAHRLPMNKWCRSLEKDPVAYARAYTTVQFYWRGYSSPFKFKNFFYDKLVPGFREIEKQNPDDPYAVNMLAWSAMQTKDDATAREELAKLGRGLDPAVFDSTAEFMALRSRLGLSKPDEKLPTVIPAGWEKEVFGPAKSSFLKSYQTVTLLRQHRFLELEALAARYRQDGESLFEFYTYLGGSHAETPELMEKRRDDLEAWTRERPDSIDAPAALGCYYIASAWLARGGGYADTVSSQAESKFEERLTKAASAFDEAERKGNKDLALPLARIGMATGQGDQQGLQHAFEQAVSLAPESVEPYKEMVTPMLPRWYGGADGLRKLSDHAVKLTRSRLGLSMAAVVGLEGMDWENAGLADPGREGHLEWSQIVQGMQDLEKHHLATPYWRNRMALRATVRQDREAARKAFEHLDQDSFEPGVWQSYQRFQQDKAWALGQGPYVKFAREQEE